MDIRRRRNDMALNNPSIDLQRNLVLRGCILLLLIPIGAVVLSKRIRQRLRRWFLQEDDRDGDGDPGFVESAVKGKECSVRLSWKSIARGRVQTTT